MEIQDLKYPIGKFTKPETITPENITQWIAEIANFPEKLKKEVSHLTENQLDTPYRPDGWTVRQVVHHCADSHMNSLTRFKLALTEETPTIKPYFEDRWAELVDTKTFPIQSSLMILEGVHTRWVALLTSLTNSDLQRTYIHPEHNKEFSLAEVIGLYAWHCNHHLAHITTLKKQKNWV